MDGVSLGDRLLQQVQCGRRQHRDYENTTVGLPSSGFPVNEKQTVSTSAWATKNNKLSQPNPHVQVDEFWKVYNGNLMATTAWCSNTVDVTAGWTRSTLNKGQFPTSGDRQR